MSERIKASEERYNIAHRRMDGFDGELRRELQKLHEVLEFSLFAHEAIQLALQYFEEIGTPLDKVGDFASDTYSKLFAANEETPDLIKDFLEKGE